MNSSPYSVYTPFLRRFTDEPARELSETIALYQEVRRAHQVAALPGVDYLSFVAVGTIALLVPLSCILGGIGMIVTLLVRANRQRQQLAAYGLSDHYREIFELTRLDEAITIYDDEASALVGATT